MTITHDYEEREEDLDLQLTIKGMKEFQMAMLMIAKNYEKYDH